MRKAVLLLVLLVCGTFAQTTQQATAQAQQSQQWWNHKLYQNWQRVYQVGQSQNVIGITDYAFYFTIVHRDPKEDAEAAFRQSDLFAKNSQQQNASANVNAEATANNATIDITTIAADNTATNNVTAATDNANANASSSSTSNLRRDNTATDQTANATAVDNSTAVIANSTAQDGEAAQTLPQQQPSEILAPYSFWFNFANIKRDGESYVNFLPFGYSSDFQNKVAATDYSIYNQIFNPADGEGFVSVHDGEQLAQPLDGEQTVAVFNQAFPTVSSTPDAALFGLDGELYQGAGQQSNSQTQDQQLLDLLLPYRQFIATFANLAPIYNASLPQNQNRNVTAQVLYINIELFVLDEPYDYVDPLLTNEAYEIFISEQGEVTLRCAGYVSFVRAITEFGHLILPDGTLTKLPLYISDFPSYSWRALMLDVSTNFIPIYTIKWLIDGMFVSKLNVLQLHLSDAQSFPYELIQFPEVTKQGAYSTYEMYTREDLVDLIIYAQRRGVVIVPEFISPVHTNSWTRWSEFQDLNACGGIDPLKWADYCDYPPCGQLDPTNDNTYLLTNSVFAEVQTIFPSNFVHLGGDKYNSNCYDFKTSIKDYMNQNNITSYDDLYDQYFNKVNQFIGNDRHRIYYYIDQFQQLTYFQDSLLQYFYDTSTYENLSVNQPIILNQYDELYLTCSQHIANQNDLINTNIPKCDPDKTWWDFYNFTIPAQLNDYIVGATASIWTDIIFQENLVQTVFPRATAFGLRLWNNDQSFEPFDLANRLIYTTYNLFQLEVPTAVPFSEYCITHFLECFSQYVPTNIQNSSTPNLRGD